jgi:lipoprotein NlpI
MNPLRLRFAAPVFFLVATGFAAGPTPRELFREAVELFFDSKPIESARVFDQLVVAAPGAEPELWQRGLALYYAERHADGQKQFELHRTVNPDDVENAVWHFLCVAKAKGPDAARKALLPVGEDRRVPMAEILALYAGKCPPGEVLAAAEAGAGEARRNQLCYAHLYVGLHFEALGDADKAREHIAAAAGPFRMDHFMGRVAVMHAKLRGWPVGQASRP